MGCRYVIFTRAGGIVVEHSKRYLVSYSFMYYTTAHTVVCIVYPHQSQLSCFRMLLFYAFFAV